VGFAGALALVVGSSAGAANPGAGYRAKAHRLSVQAQNLDTRAHHALLDLYALESRLGTARTRLATLETQARLLNARRLALAQQLDAARATLSVSQANLGEHLRSLYEQGTVDPIAVVLGAQSLDDALTKLDDLSRIADQNRQVVAVTLDARAKLVRVRATLAEQERRLSASLAEARSAEQALASARSQRLSYVDGLRAQRQLAESQITRLIATANVVELKAKQIQEASSAAPVSVPVADPLPVPAPASDGGRTMVVSATGYSLPGRTATGLPVGWGIVAVDPSVIPLGTRLTVPGYGEAVAADVGSAVRGADIDLWFPTLAQAQAWGRRTVTIDLH
jgi:3D (Asp-Asp-Asp) domain-containing protein/peptidoglycan hydrolase CwlO-like protein